MADIANKRIISIVGSGGKTSLIGYLAEKAKRRGKKAAVVTTTHMQLPKQYSGVGKTVEENISIMEREGIVYSGNFAETEGKMTFPGEEIYRVLCEQADLILVEADGSRRLPMKVPNWTKEPVIPENTDEIVVVFGLTAVGKPLTEVCQRWELGIEWLEEDPSAERNFGILVTEKLAVDFLVKGYLIPIGEQFPHMGLTVVLNQADTAIRKEAGKRMKQMLEQGGWKCRITRLKTINVSMIYMASGFGNRFGRNKLLEPVEGRRLFEHGLLTFLSVQEQLERELGVSSEIILVSQYPEILAFGENAEFEKCFGKKIKTVENPYAAEGITASIRLGTEAAAEDADYLLYSVADQPWITGETIKSLIGRLLDLSLQGKASIGCLTANGRRGNPAIFHKRYREELCALTGDKGGSRIMKRYPEEVAEWETAEKELRDIDYWEDLEGSL